MPALGSLWARAGGAQARQGTAFHGPQGSRPPSRSPREAPAALPHRAADLRPTHRSASRPCGRSASFFRPSSLGDPASGANHHAQRLGGDHSPSSWQQPTSRASPPLQPWDCPVAPPRPVSATPWSRGREAGCGRACAVSSGAHRPGARSPGVAPLRA